MYFISGARQELKHKIGRLEKQTENQQRKTEQEKELNGRIKMLKNAKTKRMGNFLFLFSFVNSLIRLVVPYIYIYLSIYLASQLAS